MSPENTHILSTFMVGEVLIRWAHYASLSSTQAFALDVCEALATGNAAPLNAIFKHDALYTDDVLVITAGQQTAGQGQHGRVWQSPAGNMYATFILPWPQAHVPLLFHAPQVVNVAVCQTLSAYGLSPHFKWVNDALLNGKKCAGVLCQSVSGMPYRARAGSPAGPYCTLVVGVGLNVNGDTHAAPAGISEMQDALALPLTSMAAEAGQHFEVDHVFKSLAEQLIHNISLLQQEGSFTPFQTYIMQRLAYRDAPVVYHERGREPQTFTFKGIDAKGQALLQDSSGQIHTKFTGRIKPLA